jgi:hypothetical protein
MKNGKVEENGVAQHILNASFQTHKGMPLATYIKPLLESLKKAVEAYMDANRGHLPGAAGSGLRRELSGVAGHRPTNVPQGPSSDAQNAF